MFFCITDRSVNRRSLADGYDKTTSIIILKKSKNLKIIKNFLSLGIIQVSSYLITLITMPYLIKVLGLKGFGIIVFAQTLVGYFVIAIDYGFSLTGTKYISENKDNHRLVNNIVSEILVIKTLIFFIGLIIFLLILPLLPKLQEYKEIFIVTYFMTLGNVFFPVYYFQGIEKMHYTALFNIMPKIVALLFIFIFVKEKDDILYVAIITSAGFAVSGFLSLVYSLHIGLSLQWPSFSKAIYRVHEAKEVFVGMLSSNVSSNSVVLILGILTSPTIVGAYSAVEKFIKPISFFSNTLMQVIYPHMVSLKKLNLDYKRFSVKITFIYITLLALGLIFVKIILTYFLGYLIGGDKESQIILDVLIMLPLFTAILNSYFLPMILVEGKKNIYAKSLSISCLISLALTPILIIWLGVFGAAIIAILSELIKIFSIIILNRSRVSK